jgi:protein SCO1/2
VFRTYTFFALIVLACGLAFTSASLAQHSASTEPSQEIGIDEKLGAFVPLDLGFLDSKGDSVYLKDVIGRPTVLTLVYFHCPSVCKPLLGAVSEVVAKTDLKPGRDYDLLTVSFDVNDTPKSAAQIKSNFVEPLQNVGGETWKFLTADSSTISRITDAVGFRFKRTEQDFAHGTSLIVLSPQGKIVRYLYGVDFMPFDLKMAVSEATSGKVVPSISRVLRYCFSYDPQGRRYVFNVTRVAGTGIVLLVFGYVFYISTIGKHRGRRLTKG